MPSRLDDDDEGDARWVAPFPINSFVTRFRLGRETDITPFPINGTRFEGTTVEGWGRDAWEATVAFRLRLKYGLRMKLVGFCTTASKGSYNKGVRERGREGGRRLKQ